MRSKELEALKRLYKCNDDDYTLGYQQHDYKLLQENLQRLEAIDNANPSEALECLEWIIKNYIGNDYYVYEEELVTIKQALLKAQEQEKVLEIIKNKKVDIWKFIDNGIFNYSYDDYYFCWNYYSCEKLTEEELEVLKRYLNDK